MRNYEVVLILAHETVEDRAKELLKRIEQIFSKSGVLVRAHHDRGRRVLGYSMKKHKEGHVYIYDIEALPERVKDLERDLRLEEKLLQVMISHPLKRREDKEAGGGR
jgi:small subunit ribosomal protein S6